MRKRFGRLFRRSAEKIMKKVPRLPRKKTSRLEKIEGTIELQKICRAFGIPFEPIKVYRLHRKVNVKGFADAERIIVRTTTAHREYWIQPATSEHLSNIAQQIKSFVARYPKRFIVQRVGLRESIESYGTIWVHGLIGGESQVRYVEELYSTSKKSYKDAFLAGDVFLGGRGGTVLKLEEGKLGIDEGNFLNGKIGNPNAHKMIEHVSSRVEGGSAATLRFVRYKGKRPCFYDMTVL